MISEGKTGFVLGSLLTAVVVLSAIVAYLLVDPDDPGTGPQGRERASEAPVTPAIAADPDEPCVIKVPGAKDHFELRSPRSAIPCAEAKQVVIAWLENASRAIGNHVFLEVGDYECQTMPLTLAPPAAECRSGRGRIRIFESELPASSHRVARRALDVRTPQPPIEPGALEVGYTIWERDYEQETRFALARLFIRSNPELCSGIKTPEQLVFFIAIEYQPPTPRQERRFGTVPVSALMETFCRRESGLPYDI